MPGVGDILGGCRLDRLAARGGMGIVYEATQLTLGRRVAVKVISPQLAHDEEFRERFTREARVAASVHHPNIVDVYDYGEQDDVLYLVMRYVDGTDLRTLMRGGVRLEPARAVAITGQVAGALDAAHGAGLIHRDVTPSNILLSGDGPREEAALTDFGLVKHLDTAGATRTGGWLGTLAFVAPEALRDDAVDGRADVYALGCVLYRMLTGTAPFNRESDAATITAHLHDPPPRPSQAGGVPPALDDVIARALAKDPEARYATAGALAADARAALTAPSGVLGGAPPAPPAPSASREDAATAVAGEHTRMMPPRSAADAPDATRVAPRRRRPRAAAVAALAGLALLLGVGIGVAADQALRDDSKPASTRRTTIPRTPAPVALKPYSTPGYRAQVPRGWKLLADDVDRGDFSESRWRAPRPYHALLVITYRRGSRASPEGIADAARGRVAAQRTYSELAFGAIDLNDHDAWRWAYGVGGQARLSWYMNPCGTSVAVYGATKPSELLRWSPTLRAVTASVQPTCA